jgi:hypothetical protein
MHEAGARTSSDRLTTSIINAWEEGIICTPDHATRTSYGITVFGACFGYTEPHGRSCEPSMREDRQR